MEILPRDDNRERYVRKADDQILNDRIPPEWQRRFSRMTLDPDPAACWEWPGANRNGYAAARAGYLHRMLWRDFVQESLSSDDHVYHLCDNRLCIRPSHLQTKPKHSRQYRRVVSPRSECANGHPWTEENVYTDPKGNRYCRVCNKIRQREWRAKKKREGARWKRVGK